jgi:hypothetical protein
MLAVTAPFAARPPRARPGGLGDPRTFARVCAVLAILLGLPAFAIGVRLFGLAEVLATLRFMGPVTLVIGAVIIGPVLLLMNSRRRKEQRESKHRAIEELASQAVETYRYDAGLFRGRLLPFAIIVGAASLQYALLLWSHLNHLGPAAALTTKIVDLAFALLFLLVFCACGKIAYLLLFRLPAVLDASGFSITEGALIVRSGGLGSDHCVTWEAIMNIQPLKRLSDPYEIRDRKGVLRVLSYVLEREALIAVILQRSGCEAMRPYEPPNSAVPPAQSAGAADPLRRFAFVAIPFLIALSVEWHRSPWAPHPLLGPVRLAVAAVPFVFLLLSRRGLHWNDPEDPWFLNMLGIVVTLHLGDTIMRVLHMR